MKTTIYILNNISVLEGSKIGFIRLRVYPDNDAGRC
jgi:hypothetical protein